MTFDIRVVTEVGAPPEAVYAYVCDLSMAGEWSPECRGGQWLHGEPGELGSVFAGRNVRPREVVAWAPVVRGEWTTECEVVDATPPTAFRWAMRDSAGRVQESVWSFELSAGPSGSRLTHAFRMGRRTEGLGQILSELSPLEQDRFLREWADKLRADMTSAVDRIKAIVEARTVRAETTR